jgi:hypothetical protein
MTRPNNVTSNYGYDNLSRLLSVLHQPSGRRVYEPRAYGLSGVQSEPSSSIAVP